MGDNLGFRDNFNLRGGLVRGVTRLPGIFFLDFLLFFFYIVFFIVLYIYYIILFYFPCNYIVVFCLFNLMMPFFNRNWAGACGGRWVGPRLLAD